MQELKSDTKRRVRPNMALIIKRPKIPFLAKDVRAFWIGEKRKREEKEKKKKEEGKSGMELCIDCVWSDKKYIHAIVWYLGMVLWVRNQS